MKTPFAPWAALLCFALAGYVAGAGELVTTPRAIPHPLPGHPGNIFAAGESVVIAQPPGTASSWQLYDYDDKVLQALTPPADGQVNLGVLPVGFYRLKQNDHPAANWISIGVLAPLRVPTPLTSPVALDVAMAWFYPPDKMDAAANLCALAGVNWVRDRLAWGQMEPRRGQFAGPNRYDASARAQSAAGLQVLQVNHSSPAWANPNHKRFPLDLRDAYRFYRAMAKRWQGQVLAFEPWNEADITVFGGHPGSEMAALQKAAYLGLKAGNPNVIACLNVFAAHRQAQLEDLRDNAAWPYFDTFDLHHYAPFEQYPDLYAAFRAVSAGKPLWVTECARPVKWSGDDQLKEPSDADLHVQAERVAKTFALSIHEGSQATFYFLLPHYSEGQTQFGLLRPDLTPRPGFVALAAVGRLMADAKPLGRLQEAASGQVYLFHVQADGRPRELLVAWDDQQRSELALPVTPEAVFNHLGREIAKRDRLSLSSAPVFALLPEGTAKQLGQLTRPAPPQKLSGKPSSIVLQSLWPEERVVLNKSAYQLAGPAPETIPVWIYNFGPTQVDGHLNVTSPQGWQVTLPNTVQLAPDERKEVALQVDASNAAGKLVQTVRITGDFGPAGHPVLSLRLMNPGGGAVIPLPQAMVAARWQPAVSGNGTAQVTSADGLLTVDAQCGGQDRWIYPTMKLNPDEVPPPNAEAIRLNFRLTEGRGQFRVIFEEANGSAYVADFMTPPSVGETTEALAFFEGATHGSDWSKPDPNHHLDPEQIRVVKVGCNSDTAPVKFSFGKLRWVQFDAGP